jgi:hypothetical protein
MIYPICHQECVVQLNGEQHMGRAEKGHVNFKGQYRILVWSHSWGYAREFKPGEVDLLPVTFADGSLYHPEEAFNRKFNTEQQRKMRQAEKEEVVSRPVPPPPPPPPTRIVQDGPPHAVTAAIARVARVVRRTVK